MSSRQLTSRVGANIHSTVRIIARRDDNDTDPLRAVPKPGVPRMEQSRRIVPPGHRRQAASKVRYRMDRADVLLASRRSAILVKHAVYHSWHTHATDACLPVAWCTTSRPYPIQ